MLPLDEGSNGRNNTRTERSSAVLSALGKREKAFRHGSTRPVRPHGYGLDHSGGSVRSTADGQPRRVVGGNQTPSTRVPASGTRDCRSIVMRRRTKWCVWLKGIHISSHWTRQRGRPVSYNTACHWAVKAEQDWNVLATVCALGEDPNVRS